MNVSLRSLNRMSYFSYLILCEIYQEEPIKYARAESCAKNSMIMISERVLCVLIKWIEKKLQKNQRWIVNQAPKTCAQIRNILIFHINDMKLENLIPLKWRFCNNHAIKRITTPSSKLWTSEETSSGIPSAETVSARDATNWWADNLLGFQRRPRTCRNLKRQHLKMWKWKRLPTLFSPHTYFLKLRRYDIPEWPFPSRTS